MFIERLFYILREREIEEEQQEKQSGSKFTVDVPTSLFLLCSRTDRETRTSWRDYWSLDARANWSWIMDARGVQQRSYECFFAQRDGSKAGQKGRWRHERVFPVRLWNVNHNFLNLFPFLIPDASQYAHYVFKTFKNGSTGTIKFEVCATAFGGGKIPLVCSGHCHRSELITFVSFRPHISLWRNEEMKRDSSLITARHRKRISRDWSDVRSFFFYKTFSGLILLCAHTGFLAVAVAGVARYHPGETAMDFRPLRSQRRRIHHQSRNDQRVKRYLFVCLFLPPLPLMSSSWPLQGCGYFRHAGQTRRPGRRRSNCVQARRSDLPRKYFPFDILSTCLARWKGPIS